jgi:hypothetical protein
MEEQFRSKEGELSIVQIERSYCWKKTMCGGMLEDPLG